MVFSRRNVLLAFKRTGVALLAAGQFFALPAAFAQDKANEAANPEFEKVCRSQIEPYVQFILAITPNAHRNVDVQSMTKQLEQDCATRPAETMADMRAKIVAGILGQYGQQKR